MATWTVQEDGMRIVVEAVGDRVRVDVLSGLPIVASPEAIEHLRRALASAALRAHLSDELVSRG